MITLTINGTTVNPGNESEINRMINTFKAQGLAVCVQLRMKTSDVDLALATDACGGGGGGGRRPNAREQSIIDLWLKHDLQSGNFGGGQLTGFLKKLL